MIQHDEFGASSEGRILLCPASVKKSRGILRESPESDGDRMHRFNECGDKTGLEPYQIQRVIDYQEKTYAMRDKLIDAGGGEHAVLNHKREMTLDLKLDSRTTFGTADDLILFGLKDGDPLAALIRDLKTHYNGIFSQWDAHWQLVFLACAAHQRYPSLKAVVAQAESHGMMVEVIVKHADVSGYLEEINKAVELALSDDPPYGPGEACHWCPARGSCEKVVERAITVADNNGADLYRIPRPGEYEIINGRGLAEQIKLANDLAKALAEFKRQGTEALQYAFDHGYENPHVSLRSNGETRSINNYEKARDLLPQDVVAELDLMTRNKWSVKDAEDATKKLNPDCSYAGCKKAIMNRLDGVISLKPKQPSVQVKGLDDG